MTVIDTHHSNLSHYTSRVTRLAGRYEYDPFYKNTPLFVGAIKKNPQSAVGELHFIFYTD